MRLISLFRDLTQSTLYGRCQTNSVLVQNGDPLQISPAVYFLDNVPASSFADLPQTSSFATAHVSHQILNEWRPAHHT